MHGEWTGEIAALAFSTFPTNHSQISDVYPARLNSCSLHEDSAKAAGGSQPCDLDRLGLSTDRVQVAVYDQRHIVVNQQIETGREHHAEVIWHCERASKLDCARTEGDRVAVDIDAIKVDVEFCWYVPGGRRRRRATSLLQREV